MDFMSFHENWKSRDLRVSVGPCISPDSACVLNKNWLNPCVNSLNKDTHGVRSVQPNISCAFVGFFLTFSQSALQKWPIFPFLSHHVTPFFFLISWSSCAPAVKELMVVRGYAFHLCAVDEHPKNLHFVVRQEVWGWPKLIFDDAAFVFAGLSLPCPNIPGEFRR